MKGKLFGLVRVGLDGFCIFIMFLLTAVLTVHGTVSGSEASFATMPSSSPVVYQPEGLEVVSSSGGTSTFDIYTPTFSTYDEVEVYNTGGEGLWLRSGYGLSSSKVALMADGTQMTVYGGPYSADGYTWWYLYGYVSGKYDSSGTYWPSGNYWGYAAGTYLKATTSTPSTPTGTSPGSTSSPGPTQSSSTVTLSWGAVSGATYYGLGVRDVQTGNLVVDTYPTGTSYTASLTAGRQYKWNVAACNSAGCSSYTTPLYFQTPCSNSLSQTSQSVGSSGGSYSVSVSSSGSCSWTATSNTSWITISSGSSGSGNGTVYYSVSANTSTNQRTGTMTIAGNTFTVTQDPQPTCSNSLSQTSQSVGSSGGSYSVSVSSSGSCSWTATSNTGWITISSGSSGTGNGTVSYTVLSNTNTSPRTGTMTIAEQTFTVTQDGLVCTYTISPTSKTFDASGGSGSVSVMPASSSCAWTAMSNASWITISSGSSGTGNGTVSYTVLSNTNTSPRTGTMTIAEQTFTVTQDGLVCTYTISPTSKTFDASGGSGSVSVMPASSSCAWTAMSNASWITISSGSSGTGNGTVSYTVSSNTDTSQRTGTMTIGGQTFTVTQSGATCTYAISPSSKTVGSGGGSESVSVTASSSSCTWTATSNASWITITSGSSGTGNGTVSYTVSSNTDTSQRTGTMTIGGQTFTVTQSGATCTYAISPSSKTVGSGGGSESVSVTASSSSCTWTATSNASWITITSGSSGTGNGTVSYTVLSNTDTSQRTGTMTIGGQTFTVTQSGISQSTPSPISTLTPPPTPLATPQPSPSPAAQEGTVFGFVYDEDERPLEGVTVTLYNNLTWYQTETDEDGYFEFGNLSQGDYNLNYEKEGYETQTMDISLEEGELKDLGTVTMEQAVSGKIYGYVVNIKGDPIEFVRLKLRGIKTKVTKNASTDADGFFEFADLEADTYVIIAKKKKYRNTRQKVVLEEGESTEIEIVMKKTSKRIKGLLLEEDVQ